MADAAQPSGCAACQSPSEHPDVAARAAICEPPPSIAQPFFPGLPSAPWPNAPRNLTGHTDANLTARRAKMPDWPARRSLAKLRRNRNARKTSSKKSRRKVVADDRIPDMTTIAKLLAQKQQLLEQRNEGAGPHEREQIERVLMEIEDALNLLDEAGPGDKRLGNKRNA